MKLVNAIEMLKRRTSCAQLSAPEPSQQQLSTLYDVAFRAADHRHLKPARFLEVRAEGLNELGELFVKAKEAANPELSGEERTKARLAPTRAPMIIVIIAHIQDDPKVPEIEQVLSVGASVQNMLNAAFEMGLGAIWRTGDLAFNPLVADGLGLGASEKLLGFLYLGTPRVQFREAPAFDYGNHVRMWP